MARLMIALGVSAVALFVHAADPVITETVNDLEPYTTSDDNTFWTVSAHELVSVRVTTDDTAFSTESILGTGLAAAIDTRTSDSYDGFLEILSTISPGTMLLLR